MACLVMSLLYTDDRWLGKPAAADRACQRRNIVRENCGLQPRPVLLRAARHVDRASVPGVQDPRCSRAVMHQVDLDLARDRIRTPLRQGYVPAVQERLVS